MPADGRNLILGVKYLWCCHLISSDVAVLSLLFLELDYTPLFGVFIKVPYCLFVCFLSAFMGVDS